MLFTACQLSFWFYGFRLAPVLVPCEIGFDRSSSHLPFMFVLFSLFLRRLFDIRICSIACGYKENSVRGALVVGWFP